MSVSIDRFIQEISRNAGMAKTTGYEVTFNFSKNSDLVRDFEEFANISKFRQESLISMFCNEAQLPNVSSLTGQTNGLFLGEGQVNYAYGKLFTDISLGWYCDASMKPLKFLQTWNDFIYSGNVGPGNTRTRSLSRGNERGILSDGVDARNFPIRVRYPEEYQAIIEITKIETESKSGQPRRSMKYTMIDAFPHSIDSTPLSYGSSQLVNVSASFFYSKYFVSVAQVNPQ